MPLYAVRGKFATGHTFVQNPVEGSDAREAIGTVLDSEDVKGFGQPVAQISAFKLTGKKKVKISTEPAKPREKKATAAAPTAPTSTEEKKPSGQASAPRAQHGRR